MKLVKISDIFDVRYGINLELNKLEICSDIHSNCIPFVSRTETNNGISAFVKIAHDIIPNPAYTISVAGGGNVLSTFYHETPFYSGHHLYILIPKFALSKKQALLYCTFIRANKCRYNYGRQANKTLKNILIPHPDELKKFPFYNIKIPKPPTKKPYHNKQISLNDREWGWFLYKDIFDIEKTIPEHKVNIKSGNIRYITRTTMNNGVDSYTEGQNINSANKITIGGESAIAFYQDKEFVSGNNITILYNNILNVYIAIFIITTMNKDVYRYSYGRARTLLRLRKEKIKLPITNTGNPDWQFMEDYIKALPYSKAIGNTRE